jgi:type I restriction enzyme, S subunit
LNPARLLEHFDRISDAPDAIPRLRRFILDLAVRGKLVEQDPRDEPINELLKRIQAEKTRLGKEGQLRTDASKTLLKSDAGPRPVPPSWLWVLLGEVVISRDGERIPVSKDERNRRQKIYDYYGASGVIDKIDSYLFDKPLLLVGEDGANLINRSTPIAFIARGKYWVNNHAHVLDGISEGFLRFIELHINAIDLKPYVTGTAQPKMNQAKMNSIPTALPPLPEQHRIVAKVDELMALCDRLEVAQAERERRRDRLTSASLRRLNAHTHAPAFHEHADFHLRHLARLTTRSDQIQPLREAILNLAVRGQLVPQDPNDEPASELLKHIHAERTLMVREGEAVEQKRFRSATDFDCLFDIAKTWRWVSLGDIALGFRYGTSVKCSYERIGEPVLRIPNVDNGRIDIEDLKFGPLSSNEAADLRLQLGDILMVRSNGSLSLVGRPALVEAHAVGFCYAGYLVRLRTSVVHLASRYLLLALNTAHVRDQIEIPIRTTVGLKNINATEMSRLVFPLPPLAEQHRIVAKVEELIDLCDRLEAQLTTAQCESRRLLEAVLHEALATAF